MKEKELKEELEKYNFYNFNNNTSKKLGKFEVKTTLQYEEITKIKEHTGIDLIDLIVKANQTLHNEAISSILKESYSKLNESCSESINVFDSMEILNIIKDKKTKNVICNGFVASLICPISNKQHENGNALFKVGEVDGTNVFVNTYLRYDDYSMLFFDSFELNYCDDFLEYNKKENGDSIDISCIFNINIESNNSYKVELLGDLDMLI